ncbi:MAG: endolytic transglycosylase MltG [Candidatus Woesebacteria bacterium]
MQKIFRFFKIFFVILILFVVVTTASLIYLYTLFQPVDSQSQQTISFVVPKGQAVSVIADRLQEKHLIKNALLFRFFVKFKKLENKIQAGSFELSESMNLTELAFRLTQGTNDLWLTIPEGWRREEIADTLEELKLETFDKDEFLLLTLDKEGYLFPDTYLVPRMIETEALVNLLVDTFDRKVIQELEKEITASGKEFKEILIMASLVEREAKGYEQMRMVTGVLNNRLEIGMALQVDASLQYVKGYDENQKSWWVPPLAKDKELDSPFNTYKYPGLPPKAICNPGFDAIKAVLNPKDNDYLYYLHDRDAEIHYAQTLEEHEVNINQYLR